MINVAQDTFFRKKKLFNCNGKLLDLSTPVIMGILNSTPDSFVTESRVVEPDAALQKAEEMLAEGALILDIGGQSTRPGADYIEAETEWSRVEKVLKAIRNRFPDIVISIDTFHSIVAERAIEEGVDMINDISGGTFDPGMIEVLAQNPVAYILMHTQGSPQTMQLNTQYEDVVKDILKFFVDHTKLLNHSGIKDVIIDPGFGFGKTLEQNYTILKNLSLFNMTGHAIMVGFSRKSMINKVLHTNPENALNGTTVLNTIALLKGADILRVHDVKEAVETIRLTTFLGL